MKLDGSNSQINILFFFTLYFSNYLCKNRCMSINSVFPRFWPIDGKCYGYTHWKRIEYQLDTRKGQTCTCTGTMDISRSIVTVDGETKSAHLIYFNESSWTVRFKSIYVIAVMPIYIAGAIAYHILRLIPLIIYVAGVILREKAKTERPIGDIVKKDASIFIQEGKRSLINIIRAPFFGIALFFGLLYSLIDPLNGRKVVSAFEREWNHGIPLSESIHLFVPRENWKPYFFGEMGYYIPGCFQPIAMKIEGDESIYHFDQKKMWKNSKTVHETTIHCFRFCC
jgi:hypothetical protein